MIDHFLVFYRNTIAKISTINFVCIIFAASSFASDSQLKNSVPKLRHSRSFSTSRDFAASVSASNLTLKNTGSDSTVVYGLYVRQISYVAAGQPCASATLMYSSSENTTAGSMVMPVTISANTEAAVGANYLYNMIYNALYYVQVLFPSSPPGCSLPGCTWGSDTTIYNWCIYVGAMAPVSVTASYTAKVVPSTTAVSAGGYNYDLISSYESIGPISCDDQTLTCSIATAQIQSF